MMNLSQTKLVGLTMELDLKAREYKKLCDKFEYLKQINIDFNDEKLLKLKQLFQRNHDEIVEINKKINELKEKEEFIEKQKLEQHDYTNIFKRNNNISEIKEENTDILVPRNRENIISKILEKIKKILSKVK